MKFDRNMILLAIAIVVIVIFLLMKRSKRECYASTAVDITNEIAPLMNNEGNIKLKTFDGTKSYTLKIITQDDSDDIMLKGVADDGSEYLVNISEDGKFGRTSASNPSGNYKFNLKKALNGDDGFYSMSISGTDKYVILDTVTPLVGVVDLKNETDLSKIPEPKGLNIQFSRV